MARKSEERQGRTDDGAAVHTAWAELCLKELRDMVNDQFAVVRAMKVAAGDAVASDRKTRAITTLARSVAAVEAAAQRMLKDARRDGARKDEADPIERPDTATVARYRAELSRRMARLQNLAGEAGVRERSCVGKRLPNGDDGAVGSGNPSEATPRTVADLGDAGWAGIGQDLRRSILAEQPGGAV
jgi:hypothetical protein